MLDIVSVLPDAREGVRRLSQVLSGVVTNTRMADVRATIAKNASCTYTAGKASTPAATNARLLTSDDAQLAQESIDRLAALIALGPPRSGGHTDSVNSGAPAEGGLHASGGLDALSEDQAEQYLTEMYDMLLQCRVPEALGELTALAGSALLGPRPQHAANITGVGGDEFVRYDEQQRRRSLDLRTSLDMYVRDGGPSPARASMDGLLCSQKLGGHAQSLLESICQLLLSCVFDPIWRHRDLLAQPRVRNMVLALSFSQMLPAFSNICVKLRVMLAKPATIEAASHAWLLGFVARNFTGMCRCMKAMVEFEACSALWAQLGDAFTAQLTVTRLVERFSATAAAVHPSYMMWRPPPPTGVPVDAGMRSRGLGGSGQRLGETYIELYGAVEVFLEGLFHLTWHHIARSEDAAAAGPPPPLLVRDVLAAMEPEGSGTVADLLAAAAAAASASDVRSGALGPLSSLLGSGVSISTAAWPALVSGPATHALAMEWLAHVVSRLDGGELLLEGAGEGQPAEGVVWRADASAGSGRQQQQNVAPLLHQPGPVDRDELPLLLSVCLAVAAAGGSHYIATGGPKAQRQVTPPPQPSSRRRSIENFFGVPAAADGGDDGAAACAGGRDPDVQHANRLLRLAVRGLKAMAATQDAELAPYPAIHSAHSCAVDMHKLVQDASAGSARGKTNDWGGSFVRPSTAASSMFGAFAPPPPIHTALLLDAFQASLLCYSAFLHPDPDKDPLTLRGVERCNEQLLELCTATGEGLRTGVAAVVYAARVGLLPALEAVIRSAALTCRLETLRVLLTSVLSSVPALQELLLSRDGYLFLTLRKLIIACVNLACPHPLEHPMPSVQHPNSRRSLTLILQQCNTPGQGQGRVQDWASSGGPATGRPSMDAAAAVAAGFNFASGSAARSSSGTVHGRPLILPLAVELLETVSMLLGRFIEVHEGRVAAASNIRIDASGNVQRQESSADRHDGDDGDDGDGDGGDGGADYVSERWRRSFEREATELLPLAQLLPFALWWLAAPASDLVDALAQEVINDDGSGSLYGDGGGEAAGSSGAPRSHHPHASPHANPNSNFVRPESRKSISSRQQSPMRRRGSIDATRATGLSSKPSVRGGVVDSLGGNDTAARNGEAAAPPGPAASATSWPQQGERSALVLSRCADTLHTLFRLMVALSDLNRRSPHPDWPALVSSLQPQQLLARAVQVLVHGMQRQRLRPDSGRSRRGLAYPILLSSLLSASVCGVQSGWLVPESFGIPSASADPADADQPPPPPPPPPQPAAAANGGGGPVQGPLFSRVRRFTVTSANPEGRAYQWAMIGDEEKQEGEQEGDKESAGSEDHEGTRQEEAEAEGEHGRNQSPQPVVLLQAAAPGGAWSNLPPPPGPAVVPTRALQVLVSEYGSAADRVLFDLLLRGLSNKRNAATAPAPTSNGHHTTASSGCKGAGGAGQFFWVPPSNSMWLRNCSNPCCMNLSGLHEAELRLAPCPRCSREWYCSRHCQAMHWHLLHKTQCAK